MPVGAAIGASAVIGAGTSLYASGKQSQAARSALGLQQQIYGQNSANLTPFIRTGQTANAALDQFNTDPSAAYAKFLNSPTYQSAKFGFNYGQQGIQNAAAAQGGLVGGGALRALEQFRSDYSTKTFDNYFNQLSDISKQGVQAGSALAGSGPWYANAMGSSARDIGAAQASGPVGAANAFTGALQNYITMMNRQNNNQSASSYSDPGASWTNSNAMALANYQPNWNTTVTPGF